MLHLSLSASTYLITKLKEQLCQLNNLDVPDYRLNSYKLQYLQEGISRRNNQDNLLVVKSDKSKGNWNKINIRAKVEKDW